VAVSKYQDALPLYRQEAVLGRSGIEIPRNTLANWMIKSGNLAQPLPNLFEETLLAYPVMHCDETTVQVLNEPDKAATSKSYMWVRVGGPPAQPVRLFHYAPGRSGSVVSELLADYIRLPANKRLRRVQCHSQQKRHKPTGLLGPCQTEICGCAKSPCRQQTQKKQR